NGVIKIPGTEIKDNSEVVANTTDPSGNESEKGKAIAGDSTPSAKPEVTADPQNGGVSVKPDPTAEKDSKTKIDYTDESGDPKEVTYTKGDDGKWHKDPSKTNINIPERSHDNCVIKISAPEQNDNSEVVANTTDPSGNDSEKVKALAGDSTPSAKPEVTADPPNGEVSFKPDPPAAQN
ncbi:hypothetical protein, partial [Campylobacter concisus]|uniref:hypothetical protein n=1 Tax=Campylobacter concisus TaxID=199 RepID=UPI001CA592BB